MLIIENDNEIEFT